MASAQLLPADPRIPIGSPLDPLQAQTGAQGLPAVQLPGAPNPVIGQPAISPYTVQDPANAAALQELLQNQKNAQSDNTQLRATPKPGEFERYVERFIGRRLPRFGENLVLPAQRDFAAPATATVPPDYVVQPGDVVTIALTGSVEGSVEREVDTNGRIHLPGVGSIQVAGVRHADLRDAVSAAIGTQFRGYTVTVTIKRLRGIRVYVTGLANNPGAFTVNSLSTLANAVFQAGGPSSGGSWRIIHLYRNGQEIAKFDLYQLMRGGSRVNDVQLQNEDVLFIPPAGMQVAVIGSVHEEAIYEAKAGESVGEMLAAAGGPNSLADRSRVLVYRAGDADVVGPRLVDMTAVAAEPIHGGDILQVLSQGSLTMPTARQSVLVRIDGEVNRPGNYYVAPNTPMSEVIALAGGYTANAYVYGTKFTRQSVRLQQQESFNEALQQLDLALTSAPLNTELGLSDAERNRQITAARATLDRLRKAEPDGRVVLGIAPQATSIAGDILLENNDTIYIPPRATTVGVFGAVYRPASFLVSAGTDPMRVSNYVEMAGGTVRSADRGQIFVVRANGEVVSRKRGAMSTRVLPGDVVFVPVKTGGSGFWAKFKDITQTLFQLGLSSATVVAVTK